jgi:hypothetical protein
MSAFSTGQNFNNELLHYSDKVSDSDEKSLETTYKLQQRLTQFYKNNTGPTLLKSKKFSGMVDLMGNTEPLGGHINPLRNGTDNAPGTGLFSDEFPFWKLANGKNEQKNEQKNAQNAENNKNTSTENFVNETLPVTQEHFTQSPPSTDNVNTIICILITILILLFLVIMVYQLNKK